MNTEQNHMITRDDIDGNAHGQSATSMGSCERQRQQHQVEGSCGSAMQPSLSQLAALGRSFLKF
jgi:hypothetical protein